MSALTCYACHVRRHVDDLALFRLLQGWQKGFTGHERPLSSFHINSYQTTVSTWMTHDSVDFEVAK
jgi:hypothetical protein